MFLPKWGDNSTIGKKAGKGFEGNPTLCAVDSSKMEEHNSLN